jgi:hypothetical protein
MRNLLVPAALAAAASCGLAACTVPSGESGEGGSSAALELAAKKHGPKTTSASSVSSTTASTGSTGSSGSGGAGAGTGLFTAANPWNTPVDQSPKSASSDSIIQWLAANGGWGGGSMRIDFSITVLHADASTPLESFTKTGDFFSPDCDYVPFPVPANGALEGETGYTCTNNGDCHLIVVHAPTNKLYEMWRANFSNGTFYGGCASVWDLGKSYPADLRGENCTSADAGGFPIAGMLFSADEVKAGEIPHAIRFILPNSRIRHGIYVHPGTHSTSATSGPANAPPYGVRFRLRPDFPLASLPSEGARVVARAMQKYGMFLADGGTIALTAADDRFTQHKWSEVGVDASSLTGIAVTDMEVVQMGAPIQGLGSCVRNP